MFLWSLDNQAPRRSGCIMQRTLPALMTINSVGKNKNNEWIVGRENWKKNMIITSQEKIAEPTCLEHTARASAAAAAVDWLFQIR